MMDADVVDEGSEILNDTAKASGAGGKPETTTHTPIPPPAYSQGLTSP
jgi:hypothetical protein